jgi:sialic acid synthase SpsE
MSSGHRSFQIEGIPVGREVRPFILAEIGINHGGDVQLAERMIRAAARAGADGVKFQTFRADDLVSKEKSPEYHDLFSKCELDKNAHIRLKDVARELGLAFISTPFSFKDVDLLAGIDVPAFKIASGDLTNHPLLKYVGHFGLPVILSTGMSFLDEVRKSREVLLESGCSDLVILHCVSRYPTPPEELNLRAIAVFHSEFPEVIGFSDHTEGTWAAPAAVALGARFVEKHFTIDRKLPGPDQALSAEPPQLAEIAKNSRLVFESLGACEKKPSEAELSGRHLGRKGLYAGRRIPAGERIAPEDIRIIRPEGEISASDLWLVAGRTASRAIREGEEFTWESIGGRQKE